MNFYIAAGIVFLLSIFGSRIINERGLKLLTTEQKGLLVQAFSDLYKYQLIFLGVVIALYFFLAKSFPEKADLLIGGYFGILLIFMIIHGFAISKKLKQFQIPSIYIRYYIISTFVKTGGMIVALAILFYTVPRPGSL